MQSHPEAWHEVIHRSCSEKDQNDLFALLEIVRRVRENIDGYLDKVSDPKTEPFWKPADEHEIDMLAERTIREVVGELDLDANVLSEDLGFEDRGYDRVLVADPIDGTFNSAWGIPMYSISLALGSTDVNSLTTGVVSNLAADETYWAVKGAGAYLNGRKLEPTRYDYSGPRLCLHMGSMSDPITYDFAKKAKKVRSLGSASLEMCYVAKGALDVFYQRGINLRIVDIAAGTLIVREAGGVVLDDKGNELNIQLQDGARSPLVCARTMEEAQLVLEK